MLQFQMETQRQNAAREERNRKSDCMMMMMMMSVLQRGSSENDGSNGTMINEMMKEQMKTMFSQEEGDDKTH